MLERLIAYIVDWVRDAGGSLTKTKLVKLLYLIDVEYCRVFRKTLTEVNWFYWLYGPYAREIDATLRRVTGFDIEETRILTQRGRIAFSYKGAVESSLDDTLDLSSRLVVQKVLLRWGPEELREILDHVYFDTAPMFGKRTGDPLDFSCIRPRALELSPPSVPSGEVLTRLAALRLRQKQAAEREAATASHARVVPPRYDETYARAIQMMTTEETLDPSPLRGSGVAMSTGAAESLREQS